MKGRLVKMYKSIFKPFYLRYFVRDVGWRLYAWAENLNDARQNKNGETFFLSNLPTLIRGDVKTFTFFDVGANIGEYSKHLVSIFPALEGHLFEPLPECIECLKLSFAENNSIYINECAVSDSEGVLNLWFDTSRSSHASFFNRESFKNKGRSIAVKTITLESYIAEKSIAHINLLKVDVEGYEFHVLKGLGKYLTPDFIDFIQFEYGGCGVDSMTTLRSPLC